MEDVYVTDPDFRDYLQTMKAEGSPAGSLMASPEHGGIPGHYFYGSYPAAAAGHHGVRYEEEGGDEEEEAPQVTPAEESSPAESAGLGGGKKKRKRRKAKRDPNKPKGWLTANLLFANANRARVKEANPDASFGDLARLLSAEYKALPPEDVALWKQRSRDDKARFDEEMNSYVPPSRTSDGGGVEEPAVEDAVVVEDVVVEPKVKKAKRKKDPNAPKRGLSAWQIFASGDARQRIIDEFPDASRKEVMGTLSARFKALTEVERAPLDELAAADKLRFQREMDVYTAPE